ncbi:MAG: lytic murein transglycosylase [Thermoleophilaceae bacterium]|nr:lytic murein transglycosylase [Thermoleophilaceae bacterium]
MKTRLLSILLAAGTFAAAGLTAFTIPAAAQSQTVSVQLPSGEIVKVTVDVPPGGSLADIKLPGTIVDRPETETAQAPPAPEPQQTQEQTTPAPPPTPAPPSAGGGSPQGRTGSRERVRAEREKARKITGGKSPAEDEGSGKDSDARSKLRKADGTPTSSNPGFVDALPGPSSARGVPNFIIRKFRVPPFLLSIYQAAGIEYGIRWEVLAAINEIETDYGRNLNVSSAGAVGWMQFMPSTWKTYGTDANKDGRKDPYNPVDAIFAAARYLKAASYEDDVRRAVFAYNHADWYVDSVLLRARLIAGVPADLIGSLTGLTEGRFPVYARARYADDLAEAELLKRVQQGENAANVIESAEDRRSIDIYARRGAPVVAVNDGVIKDIGTTDRLGHYVTLQDVYGNRYTYAHLGSVSQQYPVPKRDATDPDRSARALKANGDEDDPKPSAPASAGRQVDDSEREPADDSATQDAGAANAQASVPIKDRLFAHPDMEGARQAGGLDQVLDAKARKDGSYETYRNYFSRPFGLDPSKVTLRSLRKGSRVIGGTIIGRIGRTVENRAAHLDFSIRPAGRGAPRIDPKPILDGWKLLEATAIYRASGRNVLHGDDVDGMSIGQILLLPKPQLERRVLADERIDIYACGRDDIRSGQVDRRVLATLEYLAESGLRPTVTSLKCGHGFYTSSGNVSEHSSGNAVDIAKVNGIPILGHQEPGGITEQSVRRLMALQGTMAPHQIISLFEIGAATLAMADHADHIHIGFQPLFGANRKLGKQALAVLKPGQWSDLISRLRELDNPVVPTKPSKYALPAGKDRRASDAHAGE